EPTHDAAACVAMAPASSWRVATPRFVARMTNVESLRVSSPAARRPGRGRRPSHTAKASTRAPFAPDREGRAWRHPGTGLTLALLLLILGVHEPRPCRPAPADQTRFDLQRRVRTGAAHGRGSRGTNGGVRVGGRGSTQARRAAPALPRLDAGCGCDV